MLETPLLYQRISSIIEKQIKSGVLKMGDRLPSLRTVCTNHGVSMTTALESYHHLEKKGFIEARPQSGFYVAYAVRNFPGLHDTTTPRTTAGIENVEHLIATVRQNQHKMVTSFASGMPSIDLLPVAKLNKALVEAMRSLPESGIAYDYAGNARLKGQIARRALAWNGSLHHDEIITTSGCMEALSHCLISLTKRGDTIAVESPVFFGILQLATNLGLNVLELPTNTVTGIELDALKAALLKKKLKLCLLIPNFSNPIGSCMPDEHKKEVVRLLEHYNVPLIEDDIYGDLYYGTQRPSTCKSYDQSGIVLYCSSFSKTLAPGYRVGWVAPGKYKALLERTKSYHSISSNTLAHEAIAYFLENNRYDNHLRKLRLALHTSSLQYLRSISEYFPDGTKVSRPEGGFVLWVALPKKTDAVRLYDLAILQKINISPGQMFTLKKQYTNCFRLSTGMNWSSKVEGALKQLGRIAKSLC